MIAQKFLFSLKLINFLQKGTEAETVGKNWFENCRSIVDTDVSIMMYYRQVFANAQRPNYLKPLIIITMNYNLH